MIKLLDVSTKEAAWRSSHFLCPSGGGEFGARFLDMSRGWFQQSHEVCLFSFFSVMIFTKCSQRLDHPLYVSSDIRSKEACTLLQMTTSIDLLCNAITVLTAPQLYDVGMSAIQKFRKGWHHSQLHPNVDHWTSVWTRF